MSYFVTYQQFWCRRDTEANWAAANPVLHAGEIGVVIDGATGQPLAQKMGDGTTAWLSLPYDGVFSAVASGTNTLTATFDPTPVLYDRMAIRLRAANANTGAVTFNPNSLGALPVTKYGNTALDAGDIAGAGHELLLVYVSATPRWELQNPATAAALGGGASAFPAHAQYRSTTPISTTDTFPLDNTVPQITEGHDTGASVTIDVQDASSDLEITFSISQASVSNTSHSGFHVFRDSDPDSVGGVLLGMTGGYSYPISYTFTIPAGSTGPTTFHLRYGSQSGTGYTTYLLTLGGVNYFGAASAIGLSVKELPP